jgi:N-acetyl-gamma-glutamyl-phosphate reductase
MHNYSSVNHQQNDQISCSIVGARGYSGLETARLLMQHPRANLTHCYATSDFKITNYISNPKATSIQCLRDSELMNHLTDVVFLATPAEASLELAPKILAAGKKVIDLSGAFRLKKNDYVKWYGFEHTQKQVLSNAHYGFTAFAKPGQNPNLIANPGCYATAVSLALIPLLKNKIIKPDSIVVDAKSGTSGAGRKASENLLFTEVDGECLPYKVGKHQHYPEIVETVENFSGWQIDFHFTTSLLAVRRGIIASVYARLAPNTSIEDVESAFSNAYAENPLIKFASIKNDSGLLSLKKVVGTAMTHISYEISGDKLFVFSCIDNLIKGAAGQAIENFNFISDLPRHTGLIQLEALI